MNIKRSNSLFLLILALPLILFSCKNQASLSDSKSADESIRMIAFGSCNHEYDEQPLWEPIISNQPDLWIWLGDNIYGDTDSMPLLKAKYDQQNANLEYQKLKSLAPIIGTWDDHDYGKNDAGKEYPFRKQSRDLMYDFLDIPQDSPLREKEGAYGSYTYGAKDQQVKVILLDVRYFRDPLSKTDNAYEPNTTGTMLGEEQWIWLENELKQNQAKVTVIGSGIQVLSNEHRFEKWDNFPQERARLLQLIEKYKSEGVILLSGDRHIAEISKIEIPGISHPVYDVTSSGLTHTWKTYSFEPNQFRVGDLIAKLNFGLIRLDWQKDAVNVVLEVRGEGNELFLKESFLRKY